MRAHRPFSKHNNTGVLHVLPQEIWLSIFRNNKQPLTLIKLKLTCKLFNKIITEDEELSKILIKARKDARNINRLMYQAAKDGDVDLVYLCERKGADDWRNGTIAAIKGRNRELITFFRRKDGNNWLGILNTAIYANNQELIDEMMGSKCIGPDLIGIRRAAQVKNLELVELGIKRNILASWNDALYGAARGGHKDLIDLCIQKGAVDWDMGCRGAARGGHIELVRFFIDKGSSDWTFSIISAIKGGHDHIVLMLLDMLMLAYPKAIDLLNHFLYVSAECGRMNLMKVFIEKGANDFDGAMTCSAKRIGDMDIIKYLVECGATISDADFLPDGHWFKTELQEYFDNKKESTEIMK